MKGDNSFFLIGSVYPTLQQYSMDAKLLREFDLSVVPEIKDMIKVYNDKPKDPGSYFTIVQDAYYLNNRLYLLIGALSDGKYFCNTIVVLDVSGDEWEYTDHIRLSGKVYDTFCVYDQTICAHNPSQSCLEVFYLNDN